jgi:hypothetical protein
MKKQLLLLGLALALTLALVTTAAEGDAQKPKKPAGPTKLQHVVAFKFKEGTTPQQIQEVEKEFRALKKKIPQIAALEWGTNNSPENLNKGFTHCFILTFKSEADRETYLPHPDHKAFGKMLGPILGDVFVIDFWAAK